MKYFCELGIANQLYWLCYLIGFIVIFIFNGFYGKKYGITKKKAILFSVVSYIIIYLWAYILAWVINGFQWGHHNAVRVYIWMPLVLLIVGKAFGIEWSKACEFIAPSTCLVYAVARLGCIFPGCCYGIPLRWGMYSVQAGHNCFPVQLCQSLAAFIVFFITLLLAKRKNYKLDNKLYPQMLIMYGGARFILEFFVDNVRPILGFTELAFWGFLCIQMGIIWLLIVYEKQAKQLRNKKRGRR